MADPLSPLLIVEYGTGMSGIKLSIRQKFETQFHESLHATNS